MDVVCGVELRERGLPQVVVGDAASGRRPSARRSPRGSRPRPSPRRPGRPRRPARSRRAGGRSPRRRRRRRARAPGSTPTPRSRRARPTTPAARGRARRPGSCGVRADPRPRREPPSSDSTTGISAAASACTIEPTVVPRLRIVACATLARASGTSGCTRRTSGEARTAACRASAPDPDAAVVDLDGVQAREPVDVDEHRGGREPHRQQRDQALATGQHLGVRLAGQGRDRLGERPWPAVGERCWLHSDLWSPRPRPFDRCALPLRPVHQVEVDDHQDRAERDAAELEVVGDLQA